MKTLKEALDALMEHEFSIAEFFREEGITGSPCNSTACPVAVYLQRETGMPVRVGPVAAEGSPGREYLPFAVSVFVNDFDFGFHPDLERK